LTKFLKLNYELTESAVVGEVMASAAVKLSIVAGGTKLLLSALQ
jgi:hypothetical protein